RRSAKTYHPHEQARGLIEIHRRERAVRTVSLKNPNVLIVDGRRWTDAQAGQDLFDLRRKGQLRIEPGPVPLASVERVFSDHRERRRDPTGLTVEGPDAVAPIRVLRELHINGALVRRLRRDLHDTAAAKTPVRDTLP